jgi:hypothetical protein
MPDPLGWATLETSAVTEDASRAWFEHAWTVREEEQYLRLFGPSGEGIYVLSSELFLETFKQESFDPRWLTYGVFECAPTASRQSWLYVSSGLSNAWEDDAPNPDGPSGLGMEFIFETPMQAHWAIERLQHVVAFQILLACGKFTRRELLDVHDRIPLRCSITPDPSELTWLTIGLPVSCPPSFSLPTGSVDILNVVGITEGEASYGREHGGDTLIQLLREAGAYPVTDPRRKSICGVA